MSRSMHVCVRERLIYYWKWIRPRPSVNRMATIFEMSVDGVHLEKKSVLIVSFQSIISWSMIVIDVFFVFVFVFVRILRSTAGGQWWHFTIKLIFLLIRMWTLMMMMMLMMTISIIHLYWTFIADMHIFCMFPFLLLILSGWVVTVGVHTHTHICVKVSFYGATDFSLCLITSSIDLFIDYLFNLCFP